MTLSEEQRPSKKRSKYKTRDLKGDSPVKKRPKVKAAAVAKAFNQTSHQALPPAPYGPSYIHPQYQVPYYMLPPSYGVIPPIAATSISRATVSQAPAAQYRYPYPHASPPYGTRPHPLQPYGPYTYVPPQNNLSQPPLQSYGSSVFPGQPSYSYIPPPDSQAQVRRLFNLFRPFSKHKNKHSSRRNLRDGGSANV